MPRNLTGNAGDRRDAQRGAAAGIAVDLGEDQAGDRHSGGESLRDVDRLLARHRVDHEQGLDRLDRGIDRRDLLHQRFVDGQASGGIEDHDVAGLALGRLEALSRDLRDGRPLRGAEHGHVELAPECLELVGGGGSVRVGGDEQRSATLLDDMARQLGRRGGLARALQADHRHDSRIAAQVEDPIAGAQQVDELVVDDLHHGLTGGEALQDVLADRLLTDARDEVLDDLEVDVGLEQREAHLAHRGIDVGLADPAAAGQAAERRPQALAEGVEHGRIGTPVQVMDRRVDRGSATTRRVVREF